MSDDVLERGAEAVRLAIPSDRNLPRAQDYHRLAFEAAARVLLEDASRVFSGEPAELIIKAYARHLGFDLTSTAAAEPAKEET